MAGRLSIEGLRYAATVREAGSFSAAARAHGVTQPALSNGIATLEEYLGDRLFTRSPRGVAPTPFGLMMLPLVQRAVDALDAIASEATRWKRPSGETVRVGVSPLIDAALVAKTYSAVRALPAVTDPWQLVLQEANLAELRDRLSAGELDLIVVPSVGPMPRFEHRVIDSDRLVLVEAPSGGTCREQDGSATLAELAGKQLILMPDTCGLTAYTRDLLSDRELPVRTYPGEASSYRVLEEWSRLGLGSAMLPAAKVTDPDSVSRTMLDEDGEVVEIFYEAVWNPDSGIAPELQKVAESIDQPTS
ncbi:MAG TPA: LysR family transcriptional regulator [Ruania sp.]|nr:LysR family transcriptional regulator [Ruania sp.]